MLLQFPGKRFNLALKLLKEGSEAIRIGVAYATANEAFFY